MTSIIQKMYRACILAGYYPTFSSYNLFPPLSSFFHPLIPCLHYHYYSDLGGPKELRYVIHIRSCISVRS